MATKAAARSTKTAPPAYFDEVEPEIVVQVRNLTDAVLIIPFGVKISERDTPLDGIVLDIRETRELVEPERWAKCPNLRRRRADGSVEIFEAPRAAMERPQMPEEFLDALGPMDIEKAKQMVLNPNWEEQLSIINVTPQGIASDVDLPEDYKAWVVRNHMPKLRVALWMEQTYYAYNRPHIVKALNDRIKQIAAGTFIVRSNRRPR